MMNSTQRYYFDQILSIAAENGWTVVSTYYVNNTTKMTFICPKNHTRNITPKEFKRKYTCVKYAGLCTETAERNFRNNINEMGGIVLGKYKGNRVAVQCLCINNHICYPIPNNIKQGRRMCSGCPRYSSIEAERNFRNTIALSGGQVVGNYVDTSTAVECLCSKNHTSYLVPNHIQQGNPICIPCSGHIKSYGELLVIEAIELLGLQYQKQGRHPSLKWLRFDFLFYHNDKYYFVEVDGIQHQKETPYFHKTSTAFYEFSDQINTKLCPNSTRS